MLSLISWNVCSNNKNQVNYLKKLINKFNPDIICLQEVDISVLKFLENETEFFFIKAIDYLTYKKQESAEHYLVLVSKYPILNSSLPNKFSVEHLTRGSLWENLNKWVESVEFQFADLSVKDKRYKIFNVHLEVASGPNIRLNQLKEAIIRFDKNSNNIICGDLNIYGKWYINLFVGWLLGFNWNEYLINERIKFEELFKKNNLINIFKNKVTFPLFKLQLDHILLPKQQKIINKKVINRKFGSDHYPLFVELD